MLARGSVPESLGLENVEVLQNEITIRPVRNFEKNSFGGIQSEAVVSTSAVETFGPPVHFIKESKQDFTKMHSPVRVQLDEGIRGRREQFQFASSKKRDNERGSNSKDRQEHASKYSKYVNDLNRRSKSRSPSFGSPRGRFDAEAYKKKMQREIFHEIKAEQDKTRKPALANRD